MAQINPYLNFPGNTEEAFNFYKSIFGGDFAMIQRFGDTPEAGTVAEADKNKIMHVGLPIGNNVLMATDAVGDMCTALKPGNNISLSVSADSKDEADKIFNGLGAGGTIKMPMENTFWGAYFGMVDDKFGVQWMVSYDEKYAG
jgi:PhnB protein